LKFSITTSAMSAIRRTSAAPPAVEMSAASDSLLRLAAMK